MFTSSLRAVSRRTALKSTKPAYFSSLPATSILNRIAAPATNFKSINNSLSQNSLVCNNKYHTSATTHSASPATSEILTITQLSSDPVSSIYASVVREARRTGAWPTEVSAELEAQLEELIASHADKVEGSTPTEVLEKWGSTYTSRAPAWEDAGAHMEQLVEALDESLTKMSKSEYWRYSHKEQQRVNHIIHSTRTWLRENWASPSVSAEVLAELPAKFAQETYQSPILKDYLHPMTVPLPAHDIKQITFQAPDQSETTTEASPLSYKMMFALKDPRAYLGSFKLKRKTLLRRGGYRSRFLRRADRKAKQELKALNAPQEEVHEDEFTRKWNVW